MLGKTASLLQPLIAGWAVDIYRGVGCHDCLSVRTRWGGAESGHLIYETTNWWNKQLYLLNLVDASAYQCCHWWIMLKLKNLGHWFCLAWAACNYLNVRLMPNVGIDSKIKQWNQLISADISAYLFPTAETCSLTNVGAKFHTNDLTRSGWMQRYHRKICEAPETWTLNLESS